MDDGARNALREIIASEGEAVLDDQRRFRALLLDRCGGSRVEIKLLVAALEEGVPAMMLSGSQNTPATILVDRLTRRLEEARSLSPEPARWTVESWALALGIADRAAGASPAVMEGAGGTELANRTAAAPPAPGPAPARALPTAAPGGGPGPEPGVATGSAPAKSARTKRVLALVAAGVVAATVVGFIAVNAGGGGGDDRATRTTSTDEASAPATTTPEDTLRSHIPPKVKDSGTCTKPDVGATVRFNNVPVLVCDVAAVDGGDVSLSVSYYALPDQPTIDDGFDTEVAKYGLGTGSCDPDVDPAFNANNGTFYTEARVPVGRVLCGVDADGNPFMQWTDTRLKIYESATLGSSSTGNPDKLALKKALFGFWRDNGGLVA